MYPGIKERERSCWLDEWVVEKSRMTRECKDGYEKAYLVHHDRVGIVLEIEKVPLIHHLRKMGDGIDCAGKGSCKFNLFLVCLTRQGMSKLVSV